MKDDRIKQLREIMHTTPSLCTERAYLMTQSYRETEGQPEVIRRAKALEKILLKMTLYIDHDDLIVGRATSKRKAGPLLPEVQWLWYLEELDTMSERETDIIKAWTEEEKSKVFEIIDYWKGKSLYDKWWPHVSMDYQRLMNIFWLPGPANPLAGFHLAHCCPGFEKVLKQGLNGIKKQVKTRYDEFRANGNNNYDEQLFLNAVMITLDALNAFAKRYADLSKDLSKKEPDSERKYALKRISEICEWVPANPARTFYEALQSLWFAYIAAMLEGYGPGIGFGRIDQYLYPFYKMDIDYGRVTKEDARELIMLFYIKMNELVMPFPSKYNSGSGQNPLSVLTIGGMTKEGKDGVNELSYLFLEAEKDIQLQEDIAVRINKDCPKSFLLAACEVAKLVKGKIKFVSDETIIQQLRGTGKHLEDARDYAVTGCFIRTVPGRTYDNGGDTINLPLILELALNRGKSRLRGEQIGPKTGDPKQFRSYDDIWDAYNTQLNDQIKKIIPPKNFSWNLIAQFLQSPFISSLFESCIGNGKDVSKNGKALLTTVGMWVVGIPTIADSLAAIKKVIFDEKKYSMDRLIGALDNDFRDEEEMIKHLENAPKFGNDDDYVDSIVGDIMVHLSSALARHKGFEGIKYTFAAGSVGSDMIFGKEIGALPDGRKAGRPLSDGGISPYYGRDISGPTSTMRSVAKLDLTKSPGGNVLNMKFHPDLLKDKLKMEKFVSLLQTFCTTGGDLVQFNIVSSDTLRAAQRNPKKYKDLLVRVATYSAYFVELGKELQDQIIARTEFNEI